MLVKHAVDVVGSAMEEINILEIRSGEQEMGKMICRSCGEPMVPMVFNNTLKGILKEEYLCEKCLMIVKIEWYWREWHDRT